jgi:hypothetical protein
MNETHDPEDEFDQMLDRAVEDTAKAIKERDNQDYDGVVGVLLKTGFLNGR